MLLKKIFLCMQFHQLAKSMHAVPSSSITIHLFEQLTRIRSACYILSTCLVGSGILNNILDARMDE